MIVRKQSAAVERERQRVLIQARRQKQVADLGLAALKEGSPQQVALKGLGALQEQLGVRRVALGAWTRDGNPLVLASVEPGGASEGVGAISRRLERIARDRLESSLGEISRVTLGGEAVADIKEQERANDSWLVATLGGSRAWFGSMAFLDPPIEALDSDDLLFVRSTLSVISHAIEKHIAIQTKSFQAELLDAVGQAVIVTDLDGKITYWNRAAEEMYGWQSKEVIGREIVEVTPSPDMQVIAGEIMNRLQAGQSWRGELKLKRKDGSSFPAMIIDTPIFDKDGQLTAIIGVSTDITELRRIQDALAQSERLHRLILSNISDAVLMTDDQGLFTYICPNVEVIFGYTVEQVAEMGRIERLLPSRLVERDHLEQVGEVSNIPVKITDVSGQDHDLLVNVKLVDIDGGRVLYTGRDATERVAREQELDWFTRQLGLQHVLEKLALSGAEPAEIARTALAGLQELAPADSSAVLEFDPEHGIARQLAHQGAINPFPDRSAPIQLDELTASSAGDNFTGVQVRVDDLSDRSDLSSGLLHLQGLGVRSAILLRLEAGDRTVGNLVMGRLRVDPFTDAEVKMVKNVADTMAIGLLSRQLARNEARRLFELEAVRQASLQVTSELDLHTVLDSIASSVIGLVGSNDVHIFLHRDGELEFGVARWRDSERNDPYSEPRSGGLTARVAQSGERIVVDRVDESTLFGEEYSSWGGGIAGLPLITQGRVVGVLNVAYLQPHHFTQDELRVLGLLADQAAIAISNAELYQAELRESSELQALLKVGEQLAERYDRQDVFETIVRSILEVVPGAESASLWLFDPQTNLLDPAAWDGYGHVDLSQLPKAPPRSLVGEVFSKETPILFHHASSHPSFVTFGDERLDSVQSVFGAPIHSSDGVIGALLVDSFSDPEAFGDEDRRLMVGLTHQATAAIERARLFDQLDASRRHLEQLTRQLILAQEDERRHIARELHDEIGQLLTGAKLILEMSQGPAADPESSQQGIKEALALIKELLSRVRDLSLNLRPSMLDDLGLLPALNWHIDRYQTTTGIQVIFKHHGIEGARYPTELETTAYRVVQESLTNIARHAQVKRAEVRVRLDREILKIVVTDHGVGLDYAQSMETASASGLSGMRERVHLLGGRFAVKTGPNEGTVIRVEIPIEGSLERERQDRQGGA
ncbi:MAG: GAF domain-containing protein [Anaerolineales bacterium]